MDVKTVIIMLLCIVMAMLMWCNEPIHEVKVQMKHDTIIKEIEKVVERTKVLRHRDTVMVLRYRDRVDTIISQAPDTCKPYIVQVAAACDSVIAIKDSIILGQDTTIAYYHQLDSINSDELERLQKQRKVTRLVGLIGIGIIFVRGLFTLF